MDYGVKLEKFGSRWVFKGASYLASVASPNDLCRKQGELNINLFFAPSGMRLFHIVTCLAPNAARGTDMDKPYLTLFYPIKNKFLSGPTSKVSMCPEYVIKRLQNWDAGLLDGSSEPSGPGEDLEEKLGGAAWENILNKFAVRLEGFAWSTSLLWQATTQVHNFPTINWGFSQQLPGFESSRRLVGDIPLSL